MSQLDKAQLLAFRRTLIEHDEVLEPTSPLYVPNLHGSEAEDVINALQDDILTRPAEGSHLFYFTGQRGTGKSTELRRLETQLLGQGAQVIRFDSLDYITETEKITQPSLLLLVAAGLADWSQENFETDFTDASAWTRFRDWLGTEVELTEISGKGLKFQLKDQQAKVAGKVRDLAEPVQWMRKIQEFAGEIVQFIREKGGRERVVVIVDSLERLRGVSGAEQDDMFNHVVNTFAGDFDRLRIPGATLVYSTPPYLALLADVRNYVPFASLASVRVYDNPFDEAGQRLSMRRQPREEALGLMRALIEKRFHRWTEVMEPGALDRLALGSGGDLRHFMQRLVSAVVGQAQYALNRLPLKPDDDIIQSVLAQNKGETVRLTTQNEWPLLQDIARTHDAVALDRGDSLRTLARLFEIRVVLNYRNGAEWFDIHPLLWPLIDGLDAKASEAPHANS